MNKTNTVPTMVVVVLGLCLTGRAAQEMSHEHHMTVSPSASVTFTELQKTAAQLDRARRATEKYRDVRKAEADGYRAIGPDVPGMGIHYVRVAGPQSQVASDPSAFDVEHPAILLYEKEAATPGGYSLAGVSYLFDAEPDADGQPRNPPFPRSLASWHRHSDICVLPDRSVKTDVDENQCKALKGQFNGLTQWMVHAWIWKDSPKGVFSDTNPSVR
jgi:hypothetical protein